MEFLTGMLGACVGLLLFYTGVRAGRREVPPAAPKPPREEPLGEAERKRMQEGQEAFRALQNYSAERAYGMLRSEEDV